MMDIRKLNHVYYSQNLLNTFDKCPYKFKIKYLDNIRWKKDSISDEDYYENMNMGLDFHLICQRYFSNILVVINDSETKLLDFTKSLREKFPILDENIYLTNCNNKLNQFVFILKSLKLLMLHKLYLIVLRIDLQGFYI